jgi:hypothetical protein
MRFSFAFAGDSEALFAIFPQLSVGNYFHGFSILAFERRTALGVLLFALQNTAQIKAASCASTRGVRENRGASDGCAPERMGRTPCRRPPPAMGTRTEKESQTLRAREPRTMSD